MTYIVSGRRVEFLEAVGDTLAEAIEAYRKHYGTLPEDWEDDSDDPEACGTIIGACEGCGAAILANEKHWADEDGLYTCRGCAPEDKDND